MPTFIIEHLEPKMWPWCIIEYKHISKIVGKNNLWITNVKGCKALKSYAKLIPSSVSELSLKNACVLDPEAKATLSPKDRFGYYIFGGILGDYPPKKRTKKELTNKFKHIASRNIGKKQMSTDNAVYVTKTIIDGTPLKDIRFQDKLEIHLGKYESTILPYRYALVNGKPLISEELLDYLKRRNGF